MKVIATQERGPAGADWDARFLGLAEYVAQWSKDPSTKTGAVIVDASRRVVSVGFNGFPMGVADAPERLEDRETKYEMIVHCECNALLFARQSLVGCTIYSWPFACCAPCAAMVIQAGIVRAVAPITPPELTERWQRTLDYAATMYVEARVQLDLVDFQG